MTDLERMKSMNYFLGNEVYISDSSEISCAKGNIQKTLYIYFVWRFLMQLITLLCQEQNFPENMEVNLWSLLLQKFNESFLYINSNLNWYAVRFLSRIMAPPKKGHL